jgi:hypothetical protein
MGRLVQASVLVTSMVGIAGAGPAVRKVKVETTPPGASVYIDTLENGASCEATPCTIDVPVGSPTLIVQLSKYEPEFKQIDVTKGKKALSVSFTLKESTGYIVIDSPKGASVKINDEDEGKVPVRVKVAAEPVRVLVKQDGKTLFDVFVEVEPGGEQEVKVKAGGTAVATGGDGEDDGDGGSGDSGDGEGSGEGSGSDGGAVDGGEPVTGAARAPYLQAGIAFDIGFRRFVLSDGTSPFANSGEIVVGPAVELWPGRMAGVHLLRGLSLFARVQFAVTHPKVTRDNMGTVEEVGAETFWGGLEVSLRHKWIFGDLVGVEASMGYVRDQVEFNAINDTILMQVPSADYRSIRIGARVSLARPIEPYLSIENRVVLSGGELENRADNATTSGYALAGGINAKLGPLGVRAEASLAKYSWTYTSNSSTPPAADGASDKLIAIMFVVGYQY